MGGITVKKRNFKRLTALLLSVALLASTIIVGAALPDPSNPTKQLVFNFTDDNYGDSLSLLKSSADIYTADGKNADEAFSDGMKIAGDMNLVSAFAVKDGENFLLAADASFELSAEKAKTTAEGGESTATDAAEVETPAIVYARASSERKFYAVAAKVINQKAKSGETAEQETTAVLQKYEISVLNGSVRNVEASSVDLTADAFKDIKFADVSKVGFKPTVAFGENKVTLSGKLELAGVSIDLNADLDVDSAETTRALGFANPTAETVTVEKITADFYEKQFDYATRADGCADAFAEKLNKLFPITQKSEEAVNALVAEYEAVPEEVRACYKGENLYKAKSLIDSGVTYYDGFENTEAFVADPTWQPATLVTDNKYGTKHDKDPYLNITNPDEPGFWGIRKDSNGNNALNLRKHFLYEGTKTNASSGHVVIYNLKSAYGGNNSAPLYQFSGKVFIRDNDASAKNYAVITQYDDPTGAPYNFSGLTVNFSTKTTSLLKLNSNHNNNRVNVTTDKNNMPELKDSEGQSVAFKRGKYITLTFTYDYESGGYTVTASGENTDGEAVQASAFYTVATPISGAYIGTLNVTDATLIDDVSVIFTNAKLAASLINNIGDITIDNAIERYEYINKLSALVENLPSAEKSKLTEETRALLKARLAEATERRKEYLAKFVHINNLEFEDEIDSNVLSTSGTLFERVANPSKDALNSSETVLQLDGKAGTTQNKVAAYIPSRYIDDPIYTASADVYINGKNSPIVFFDYKSQSEWTGAYLNYDKNVLSLVVKGRVGTTGISTANYDITTMTGKTDYDRTWAKLSFTYVGDYVTVQILFNDGNIGEPLQPKSTAQTAWSIKLKSGSNTTYFGVGNATDKQIAYVDNLSVNTNNGSDDFKAANSFNTAYGSLLRLTPSTLSNTDMADVDSAISTYAALSDDAKRYYPLADDILNTLKGTNLGSLNDNPSILTDRSAYDQPIKDDFSTGYFSKWYRNVKSGFGEEKVENGKLYLKSPQSFYSMKDRFVPDNRRLTGASLTVEALENAVAAKPLRVIINYKDQSNFTYLDIYKQVKNIVLDCGTYKNGAVTMARTVPEGLDPAADVKALQTDLSLDGALSISYTISLAGRLSLVITDSKGTTFEGLFAIGNASWDFALGAVNEMPVHYDDITVTYERASFDPATADGVSDTVVYYTSNTFLDTDSVALLEGDSLGSTVSSIDVMEVPDAGVNPSAPQYVDRTSYDDSGVAYFDADGNNVKKDSAGRWYYTGSNRESSDELKAATYGKTVTLDPTASKWYYSDGGNTKYIEGKAATVHSEYVLDPTDVATVWGTGTVHNNVKIVQKTSDSLKFIIPTSYKSGIYLVRLHNVDGTVSYHYLNTPNIDYTVGSDGETTAPGNTIEIIGENLAPHLDEELASVGNDEAAKAAVLSKVNVWMSNGQNTYNLEVVGIESDYRVQAKIPSDVVMNGKTEYEIMVHSQFGDNLTWSLPYKIYVAPDVRNSWGNNTYNIKNFNSSIGTARFNAGPTVAAALDYITNNGGGTLYFPAGMYSFMAPIVIPQNVRLIGESKETVQFNFADHFWEIGSLPRSLVMGNSNFEINGISFYVNRAGGFVNLYGENEDNVYIENCRFRLRHDAGALSTEGPLIGSSAEVEAMIQQETKGFQIATNGTSSNVQFRNYYQYTSLKSHRPIVVYDNYAKYWVLDGFQTNGGWAEFRSEKALMVNGETDDCCFGAWGNGFYIQDWYFNTLSNNNREAYVADMPPDAQDVSIEIAFNEDGTRMLDDRGLPTVYKVPVSDTDEYWVGQQVMVFDKNGKEQSRTIRKVEAVDPNSDSGKYITLDRPFTVEVFGGVTRCNIRKSREDIYFVNNKLYDARCFGFYGAVCDIVYDGNYMDKFRELYIYDVDGDCDWYITFKDNYMTGDHYLWHDSNDDIFGHVDDDSAGFTINGNHTFGIIAVALRNNISIHHRTEITANKLYSRDAIVEHEYNSDVSRSIYASMSNGGVYLYKNVAENCTSPAQVDTGNTAEGYKKGIIDNGDGVGTNSVRGDVNLDGKVDLRDVTTIRNYVAGKNTALTKVQRENGDVDGDGELTLVDATYLRYYILGLIDDFDQIVEQ